MDARDRGRELELSKKIFELSTLVEVSKEFLATLDRGRINSKIVFTLMGVVGAKRGLLFGFRPETRRLEPCKEVNLPAGCTPLALEIDPVRYQALQNLSGPAFVSSLPPGSRFLGELISAEAMADPLVIPLAAEGNLLGLVLLSEKLTSGYSAEDLATLTSLAGYASMALHKKAMMEMLVRSEKLADLGRLGSGIVHEIKNPLTSIVMLSEMVAADASLAERNRRYLGIIGQEAQRILRLCQNLLSLSRPSRPEMQEVELNRLVENTLALVGYELKKHKIETVLDLEEGGVTALGDPEKLTQVILNLAINGAHSMTEGGRLTITTRRSAPTAARVPAGHHCLRLGEASGSRGVLLSVRDEGCGIAPEVLERIFEPFFSTKGEGSGTGLGLYVTRNIILDHHGTLTVLTRPGTGTLFRITLARPPRRRRNR
jgi:signal transduction histidine kinase